MGKIEEAVLGRAYKRIFVCKKCKTRIRTDVAKVLQRKAKCRRCGCKALRAIKKGK